jgi:cyclopropane fatty-acyl-phospholipid synthase-like methyltransferase
MSESKPLSRQFDDAAQLYDEVRPRYPEEIIEHIIAFAALPAQGRVFEVGCGTGQMTLPFAQRGYTMVALEQGERLAALAAQHCRPYPQVRVVPCAFEAWQDAPESYDLLLSAQAFHWIDPAYGFARAAELLKTGGTIALVWRLDRSQGSAFWQATEPIYNTYNPQTSSGNLPLETKVDLYRQVLRTSRQFTGMHEVSKASMQRYSGEEYLKLLQTFSDHRAMPEPNKSRFFEAISQVIAQMGGEVIRDYETLALLAKKG